MINKGKLRNIMTICLCICVSAYFLFVYYKCKAYMKYKNAYLIINAQKVEKLSHTKKKYCVYFYKSTCPPCNKIRKNINNFARKYKMKVYGFSLENYDDEMYAESKFKVRATPTIILYEKGKENERIVGYHNLGELRRILLSTSDG